MRSHPTSDENSIRRYSNSAVDVEGTELMGHNLYLKIEKENFMISNEPMIHKRILSFYRYK